MEAMDPFIDDLPIKIPIFQFAMVVYHSLYQGKNPVLQAQVVQVVCPCGASSAFCPTRGLDGCLFSTGVRSEASKTQRNVVIQLKFGKDWKLWYDPNL